MTNALVPTEPTEAPSPLLTVDAAATRLAATPRFIRRLVAERRIVFYRVGKFIRFDPDDVEAFIREGRIDRSP